MRLQAIQCAVVIVPDLARAQDAYGRELRLQRIQNQRYGNATPAEFANQLGLANLIAAPCAWFSCAQNQAPWLVAIESPSAQVATPFARLGWMALGVAVKDVRGCAQMLQGSDNFKILSAPKNLEFNETACTMHVAGPAGEVWHLTEVKAATPSFRFPRTERFVDQPFMAVLASNNEATASAFYLGLGANNRTRLQTKLTSFNRAHALPENQRHSVAFVELQDGHLIEIDQPDAELLPAMSIDGSMAGIAAVLLHRGHPNEQRALRGPAQELLGFWS